MGDQPFSSGNIPATRSSCGLFGRSFLAPRSTPGQSHIHSVLFPVSEASKVVDPGSDCGSDSTGEIDDGEETGIRCCVPYRPRSLTPPPRFGTILASDDPYVQLMREHHADSIEYDRHLSEHLQPEFLSEFHYSREHRGDRFPDVHNKHDADGQWRRDWERYVSLGFYVDYAGRMTSLSLLQEHQRVMAELLPLLVRTGGPIVTTSDMRTEDESYDDYTALTNSELRQRLLREDAGMPPCPTRRPSSGGRAKSRSGRSPRRSAEPRQDAVSTDDDVSRHLLYERFGFHPSDVLASQRSPTARKVSKH